MHLSVRVPWHDAGWTGTVCNRPAANTSCLILPRIGESRDDAREVACAGRRIDQLPHSQHPACVAERGTFMSSFPIERRVTHPYAKFSDLHKHFDETPFTHAAHSAACVPFYWMLYRSVRGDEYGRTKAERDGLALTLRLGFDERVEPAADTLGFETAWVQSRANQLVLLDTFFSAVREDTSLCFFYAKRTPLAEDNRRVIVGVGLVQRVEDPVDYKYRDGSRGSDQLEGVIWERNVRHSIRITKDGFEGGFIFPYQDILAAAEKRDLDIERYVCFAPDESFFEYSYGSAHVSNDSAVASLVACARTLREVARDFPGNWDNTLKWVDTQLARLWEMRGPYPGLGAVLTAFGIEHGTLLAYDIALAQERSPASWDKDPWNTFEAVLKDPGRLGTYAANQLGKTFAQAYSLLEEDERALMKLLSRFTLTNEQAGRWLLRTARRKRGVTLSDRDILENPYRLYEHDRHELDAIPVAVIDRGMFPQGVVREEYPVPQPSAPEDAADPRRARAFIVDTLAMAAREEGHTLLPVEWVEDRVQQRDAQPACPLTSHFTRVVEPTLTPLVQVAKTADGEKAWQLDESAAATQLIRSRVLGRRAMPRFSSSQNWRSIVDKYLPPADPSDVEEPLAREEKAAALEQLYCSTLSVLVGAAGTGKTSLVRALASIPDVAAGKVLLLAPTGKARVRLEQATGGKIQAFTIAQYLLGYGRYDAERMRYVIGAPNARSRGYRTIVIDESSMLTEPQIAAIFDTFDEYDRVIFVGDPRQLPPIGPGRPFADLVHQLGNNVAAGSFPRVVDCYAELTIGRRQRGSSTGRPRDDVRLATWFSGASTDPAADELWKILGSNQSPTVRLVEWSAPEELHQHLRRELVQELQLDVGGTIEENFARRLGAKITKDGAVFKVGYQGSRSAVADVSTWQILSPVHAALHGVGALNRAIKTSFRKCVEEWLEFGPGKARRIPKAVGPERLLYGDKVISVDNGNRLESWSKPPREKIYIANGDIGLLVGQFRDYSWPFKKAPWKLEVEFEARQGKRIEYFDAEFQNDGPLELAYALTVHKVQGSEFGTTFLVLPNPCRLLSRELLYTALTRHEHRVVILHQGPLSGLLKYAHPSNSELARRLTNLFEPPRPVQVRQPEGAKGGTPWLEDRLIHRTTRDDSVRSKSELVIAEKLYEYERKGQLSYQYEQLLEIENDWFLPDFTITNSNNQRRFIWEHLGLLNKPDYAERWQVKKEAYAAAGILPPNDPTRTTTLIETRDAPNGGLDASEITRLIEETILG